MKKLLLTAAALLVTLNIFAQGQGDVNFNSVGYNKPIYGPDGSTPANGSAAQGPTYRVALYWGAAGETDDRNLTQIGASAGILASNPGYFNNLGRTISYTTPAGNGATLSFQVRGWATAAGTTYEAALAAGGATGKSGIFSLKTHDPTDALTLKPDIGSAAGFQSFAIVVPEPSVIGLGILGAGALLMLRRRK